MDLVEQHRHVRIMEKHVLFGSVIDSELPAVIARIVSPSGVLRGAIDDLIGQCAPLLGWVGSRVRQYCGRHQAGVFVVPDDLAVNLSLKTISLPQVAFVAFLVLTTMMAVRARGEAPVDLKPKWFFPLPC